MSIRPITPPGSISILEPKKILDDEVRQDLIDAITRIARNSNSLHLAWYALEIINSDAAKHDLRVSELIRYNSEQIIKRRVLAAQLKIATECLSTIRSESQGQVSLDHEWVHDQIESALKQIENFDPTEMGKP